MIHLGHTREDKKMKIELPKKVFEAEQGVVSFLGYQAPHYTFINNLCSFKKQGSQTKPNYETFSNSQRNRSSSRQSTNNNDQRKRNTQSSSTSAGKFQSFV